MAHQSNLPITNFVNISIVEASRGIAEVNINNIAIFTDETPVIAFSEHFLAYTDASSVATDWGTNSEVFQQAVAVFAQTPNILTGNGKLIIIPLETDIAATAGTFTTPDISTNLGNFITVDDGALGITIDLNLTAQIPNLDFTNSLTLGDIASVLDSAILGATVTVFNGKIVFTSNSTGVDSKIVLSPPVSGTDITIENFLDINKGLRIDGQAIQALEPILDAIIRTRGDVFYGGILSTLDITPQISVLAPFIQSIDKLLFFPSDVVTQLEFGSDFSIIQQSGETHTRCIFYGIGLQEARIMAAAYASRGMSVNFNAINTTLTMQFKDLQTIVADNTITNALYEQALQVGADIYASIRNVPKVTTSLANQPFDQVYNILAYKFDLEASFFNVLATTSTKIPQTEEGMNVLLNAGRKVSTKFVANGFLAPGTWNSTDTIGDPADLKRNIEEFGYYWISQPISQQSQSERAARIAPLISNASKSAGAIHSIIINILFES